MSEVPTTRVAVQNDGVDSSSINATAMPDEVRAMLGERGLFGPIFRRTVTAIVVALVMIILALLAIAFIPVAYMDHFSKVVVAKLIQVTFGMVLGTACVIFGVVLCWLAVTASVSVQMSSDTAEQKLKFGLVTTSPGVVLIIGGIILTSISLYRPVEYSRETQTINGLITEDVPTGQNDQT